MGKKSGAGRNKLGDDSMQHDSYDITNDGAESDNDFKPQRTTRSKRLSQGNCSKQLAFEDNIKKTSNAGGYEKVGDGAVTCETRSTKSNNGKESNAVQAEKPKIRVRKDSELKLKTESSKDDSELDEVQITPLKSKKRASSASSNFCPICQVPLNILKISAASHTATCSVSERSEECPDGSRCLNTNMFHYRDFSHGKLAAFRVSEDYVESDVIFTPQKGKPKHTPLRTSSGKKRLSKSPLTSPARKVLKASQTPKTRSSSRKNKQLLSEKEQKDNEEEQIEDPKSISPRPDCNDLEVVGHQSNQDAELSQESIWCSDLILSEDPFCPDQEGVESLKSSAASEIIKIEPNNLEENANRAPSASANVLIHYDSRIKEKEQNLIKNQVMCSESCTSISESSEVFQANCSVTIKASGIDKKEAMAQCPLSVTLSVNSTGWEAVQIMGKSDTSVPNVEVSLCQCSHLICIECCVNKSNVTNEPLSREQEKQEEKFFALLGDIGLKTQQSVQASTADVFERKRSLLENCNQITIAASETNSSIEEQPSSSTGSREHSGRVVDAFALLKSATSKRSDSFTSSTRSIPTPVPMVASKASHSSWTLTPGERKLPAYKRIPDTPFVVDAFNYGVIPGVKVYFLSHFHSDHFIGLRKNFSMPIFCSQVTANLVNLQLRVDKKYLHVLKIGEPRVVCGVEVEVYDANHCPGAIMFLFRLLDGRVFLHVGDFRAHPSMEEISQLKRVDKLYLDTTYCDPAYDFPYQEDVVNKVVETTRGHLSKNKPTLIVCGTYTIGKEKVFLGIAEAFNFKIWCSGEKHKIYKCLEDKALLDRLTTDPLAAQVHVLAMRDISMEALQQYLSKFSKKYSHVVGFKPTGWTTSKSMNGKPSDFQKSTYGKVTIYGVPYSEHSSFSELRRFVRFVRPKDIQVTVNVNKRSEYQKLFTKWLSNNNDSNGQAKVLNYFTSSTKK